MERIRRWVGGLEVSHREWIVLAALLIAGLALRIAVTYITKDASYVGGSAVLAGDQSEYHATGRLFAEGHPFWGIAPFGEAHPSVWKPPGYGFFVGVVYTVLGESPVRVGAVQGFIGLFTIILAWLLGRRLFNPGVGLVAAAIATFYPLAWQYGMVLYPEALAVPLMLWAVYLFMGREPTWKRAAAVGAVIGVIMLMRPTSVFMFLAVLGSFWVASNWRRAISMTAVAVATAALVIVPWTIRNYVETDHFIPLSVQDVALQGTFNDEAANDDVNPWAWRPLTKEGREILQSRLKPTEVELRDELVELGTDYIKDHPSSVVKAFYWNGIIRLWDLRSPDEALDETEFEGRSRTVGTIGLVMYYALLPLALVGLFLVRRRKEIVVPIVLLVIGASIVFLIAAATRYRAPMEPLIGILAASVFAGPLGRLAHRHLGTRSEAPA
jgi:4-amino-4-deoxy-L-arabinose transferase-like glycosyltransferase